MGFMTLEEMTQEVSLNMQGLTSDATRLTRWVNFGMINLATFKNVAKSLVELRVVEDFPLTAGTTEYAKPEDLLAVKTITIPDLDVRLTKSDRDPINFESEEEGEPKAWTRRGSNINIFPIPDEDYDAVIEYVRIPERLSERADVTEFDAGWDLAIIYLATHHGYLGMNKQDEADRWLGRALGYISSRISPDDIEADTPRGGVNVAWEWDDIRSNPPQYEE